MKQYMKKPVVVDAIEWDGADGTFAQISDMCSREIHIEELVGGGQVLVIHTLEGNHVANEGDMIIRGVENECYPCKPGIFAQSYVEVER